ncbi:Glycine/sarcosine N-methyltransferase [uncultured Roseburia sp.]|uniref:Methyltransferase domain-containing protein n=1 Tax=Brotonthovivens ammoniilytica TaxID=2981725 RepID=A0ABT2TN26_9FIRM|nr:class I SAM-dependent methyltransferase [Brotonthovivens ammoniilytica]MCU6763081.1 methyltransferase domain-containing protein [Brotonthovivens ammoniilytica]SCJ02622.1 Glycine/sarcosine N-methyltransferase [uncultured Roseburia sp.]
MEAYTGFAEVYDTFMDNVPYELWGNYLWKILKEHGINDGLVLDLGCGTGKITRFLSKKGYDMIGVDLSEEMLEVAGRQDTEGILYLQQDMREFELYGTVGAVVSVCDSVNYLLEEEELLTVFLLVNNYLDPGGIFVFDLNTIYKYSQVIGDAVICENREHASFIWENYFDEESSINEYALTLFIEEEAGLFRRYEEFHYQRAYELSKIEQLLKQAGLELLAVTDEEGNSPGPECERVYFIARECLKKQEV